jgi:hypothetical protein
MSGPFESAAKISKAVASMTAGASGGALVATAIKIFFPDLHILHSQTDAYELCIGMGVALERFVNFGLFVLLPRGAQLLLIEIPRFLEARKCWNTLTIEDKQEAVDSLFNALLYRSVPKTVPQAKKRLRSRCNNATDNPGCCDRA